MFASDASERSCSSAAAFSLPLLGSEGLEAGACEDRAERRGVPFVELRFERRCSGEDMVGVLSLRQKDAVGVGRESEYVQCLDLRGLRCFAATVKTRCAKLSRGRRDAAT